MVEFSNKWYRETCTENGLNPENELSKTAVNSARNVAIDLKKYMDAKKSYDDTKLHEKLDKEIERLDNVRVGYMLDALFYAEIMGGFGDSFNTFVKQHSDKRSRVGNQQEVIIDDAPHASEEVKKRINDRWERAMKRTEG